MGIDGLSGAGGDKAQTKRKTPDDYKEVDIKDSNKLAEHLAGIETDLDGKNGVIERMSEDGVIDTNEKLELKEWENYLKGLGTRVVSYFQSIRQTATDDLIDKYILIRQKITSLTKKVESVLTSQTDTLKRQAAKIRWSSSQTRIKEQYEGILQLAVEHPRAAASRLNNLIARYEYNPNSSDDEMLSPEQQTALRNLQKALDKRANEALADAGKQTEQLIGSSFYDTPKNRDDYAAVMKKHGHSHDLRADLGVVLPEEEQQ